MTAQREPGYRARTSMITTDATCSADRLTAAFARAVDARYAIAILEGAGTAPVRATMEELRDERGAVSLIVLRVDLTGLDRTRVLAAISGGHGVPIAEPDPSADLVQVA